MTFDPSVGEDADTSPCLRMGRNMKANSLSLMLLSPAGGEAG